MPCKIHRGAKQNVRNPPPPTVFSDEKANHRPDGLVIHWSQHLGMLQSDEPSSWTHTDPTDRFTVEIHQKPRLFPTLDDIEKRPPVDFPLVLFEFLSPAPPPHTPATAAGAAFPE
jgi:hypothetical protein